MRTRLLLSSFLFPALLSAAEWSNAPMPYSTPAAKSPTWLRCFIRVQDNMTIPAEKDLWRDSVTLSFAKVEQPFRVYLNGKKIIESPAIGATPRRFKVPKGILEKGAYNNVTIELEKDSPIGAPPVLAGYFDELVLSGDWQRAGERPTPDELAALKSPPAVAFFTEKQFRRSVTPLSPTETMPGQRLAPAEALSKLKPGDGWAVDQLLHEPLVAQPTHLSFDERGRLWVSQYRQYPYPAGIKQLSRDMFYRAVFDRVPPPPPGHDRGADRITVHADTDGDGVYDSHKTVLEGLNMANAAVRGWGGIWVMHTPYLLFYPDADGDDVPDRAPEVRLAGFGLEDTHSVANGLAWGPDGWLYGGQGSTVTCRITRPDVDSANTPPIYYEGCMVWRYHPQTRVFEIFAEGGGNTFGLEFDAEGRLFSGHNGGDTRGWHFVQSGIYLKQGKDPGKFGPPTNPFALGELNMMKSAHPIQRFTHHLTLAEGTAVPAEAAGKMLGVDPLHRKVTVSDRIVAGPTFSTKDTGAAVTSEDIAFRPVFLTNAPDGSIYVADFCEEFIAHGQNYQGQIDPSTGRIYRLRGKDAALRKDTDLSRQTTDELIGTLQHPNRWHRQTAARLLGEKRDPSAAPKLRQLLQSPEAHPAVEALWALHQASLLDEATGLAALRHPAPIVRAWAIRLLGDKKQWSANVQAAVLAMLNSEEHAEVRAQVASTARRLPFNNAKALVSGLAARSADANDPFVPLLCWWTLESHIPKHAKDIASLFTGTEAWKSAVTREHLAPRFAQRLATNGIRAELLILAEVISAAPMDGKRQLVQGFEDAFKGRALPPMPEELVKALAQAGNTSLEFQVRSGQPAAVAEAIKVLTDASKPAATRQRIARVLGETKIADAVDPLLKIVATDGPADLRKEALTALLPFAEERIGSRVGESIPKMPAAVRPSAITLLASRVGWQPVLISHVKNGIVSPAELPPDIAERLKNSGDDQLNRLLAAPSKPATVQMNEKIRQIQAVIAAGIGNAYEGEKLYEQRCAACHQLFHKGGRIGPNLTAYQRDDLATMLTSIISPNAEIREGYENVSITTKDGRVLGGFIADKDAQIVILRGFDGQDISLPQSEISELKSAGRSLMPDGLLEGLTEQQIRDFFAYLRIPQPISK
jgi:putative heme-binding domain-containing protein